MSCIFRITSNRNSNEIQKSTLKSRNWNLIHQDMPWRAPRKCTSNLVSQAKPNQRQHRSDTEIDPRMCLVGWVLACETNMQKNWLASFPDGVHSFFAVAFITTLLTTQTRWLATQWICRAAFWLRTWAYQPAFWLRVNRTGFKFGWPAYNLVQKPVKS